MIKIEKADKILKSCEKEIDQNGLFYSRSYASIEKAKEYYKVVLICSNPLPIGGRVDERIAQKIAEKYGIALRYWDFGRGEDESNEKNIFCAYCSKESQIKPAIEKVKQAKEDLEQKLNKLTDLVFE